MIILSVIIPTRNRALLLERTLESIKNQTFDKEYFEVIVIDNGSSDNTKGVYELFQSFFPNIQYIYDASPGLHVGRNLGYQKAKGDILVYVDDDIEAFPRWLETIINEFDDKDVAMVGGKNLPNWEIAPPEWLINEWNMCTENGHCITALSILDMGDEKKRIHPHFIFGCNFSVRKELIQMARGFHPDGMPNELIYLRGDGETYISQLAFDNNKKAIYHPEASVYHWVSKSRMTFDYFAQRSFNQGISDSYTYLRNNRTKGKSSLEDKAFIGVKKVKRVLKSFLKKTDKSVETLNSVYKSAYEKGYEYHQFKYFFDAQLRDWVHKEDYLLEL